MKVDTNSKISFGRALTTAELSDYQNIKNKAIEAIGGQDKSVLIVHDACLPQAEAVNSGVGHLASKDSSLFFDFMKAYLPINTIEVLPPGQISRRQGGFYCSYASTGLSLGDHQINPKLLTTPEFGEILKNDEFDEIVKANVAEDKTTIVNFENVVGDNTPHENALKKAFDRFESSSEPKVTELKQQFDKYKTENNDWLEPKGIFQVLRKEHGTGNYEAWANDVDKNLYNPDFDRAKAKTRIDEVLAKNTKEVEFYKFKQFMADEHLKLGKNDLNKKGLKLFGDCLIGFSADETWAYPKAFETGAKIGLPSWGLPALDYKTIKDENSDAAKLLKRKVGLFAKRYDSIRFDVSWAYVAPRITPQGKEQYGEPLEQGDSVLKMIEKTVKEVKGNDFNLKDLLHEFEAGDEFTAFPDNKLRESLKNRTKVFGTSYMGNDWGSNSAFIKRGLSDDEILLGVGNHDPIPLRQLAEIDDPLKKEDLSKLAERKAAQIEPLSNILKLDKKQLENPIDFAKAKFAEVMTGKNKMFFYMDVLGKKERFDSQDANTRTNYRYKITDTFESDYHKALQEGHGFNLMDSLEKVFKAKDLDKKHPELYKSIVLFRDTITEKGVTTEKEANETIKNPIKEIIKEAPNTSKTSKYLIAATAALAVFGGAFIYLKPKSEKTNNDTRNSINNRH